LRKAIRTAGYGTAPFLAYMTLLGLCYDDDATVQVTWRALQARSGGMANATLDRALKHLERHGWLARERAAGQGSPAVYTLHLGLACQCRPGRGHPTTSTERMRKLRARRQTAGIVTLTGSKDVTATGSKECDGQREQTWPGCDTSERHIPQVDVAIAPYMYVSPGKTTETTAGGAVKNTPSDASPDVTVTGSKGVGVTTPRTAIPPVGATLPQPGDDGDSPADASSHPRSRSDDYPPAGPSLLANARGDTSRDLEIGVSAEGPWGYETGPCARCRQPCHRYGPDGSPLCPACWALRGKAS